ncbi:MAG: thermosome subunit beta [Candidatus Altarchaeaceae archaeon]
MAEQIPIMILPEGTGRTVGNDARRTNILAAKAVADAVKTTLGPKGMDKMLVDSLGDVTITNDGATIVDKLKVSHPAAKMMVEIAKTQEKEVGDGTTTAVIIAGELLSNALELIESGIHPSAIINGYSIAKEHILKFLDEVAIKVDINDKETIKKIAITTLSGKGSDIEGEYLAELYVDAVVQIAENVDGKLVIDQNNIQIIKKKGGNVSDSQLIKGMVIEKEIVNSAMPKKIKNAKIALINAAIEIKKTETKGEIEITTPEQMQAFLEQEERMLKEMVDKIKESGANVVFSQKGIDDIAQYYLAKYGIAAARRVKESDMKKLSKATGARIVNSIRDLQSKDLGKAEEVEEVKIAGDELIFVKGCENPKAVTILLRGGAEHVLDEVERAAQDAIGALSSALELGKVVTGAGAIEIEMANELRNFSKTQPGKEQLAIEAFADSIEEIPKILAQSAGMDVIDTLVKLKKAHSEGKKNYGVDVINAEIADMYEKNIIEPLKIKTQSIKSAAEAANMILRIDDVIAASKKKEKETKPPTPPSSEFEGM